MITHLRGILTSKQPPLLVIDVGGVGYSVYGTSNAFASLPEVNQQVFLYTYLVVREDSNTLYGFANLPERTLFGDLIKVSGVGPKLALTILSGIDVTTFLNCVATKDNTKLVKVPGIGKKTAERLVLEMYGKIDTSAIVAPERQSVNDAISALEALGYKRQAAATVVRKLADKDASLSSEQLIKLALKELAEFV